MPKQLPHHDELEVSVFGPGFGECIAVHLAGRWIVIDCCMDAERLRPAPLIYFDEIGVDPGSAVDLILITYWHDDHVTGIDGLAEACPDAELWCSEALRCTEFLQLLEIDLQRPGLRFTRGVQYIDRLIKLRGPDLKFAMADMRIHHRTMNLGGGNVAVELWALSPSQAENNLARARLGSLVRSASTPEIRVPDVNPNHTSVAAVLVVGNEQVLLGADLEETGNPASGWSAVVSSPRRPAMRAKVFKVPHHGSATGHHDRTWQTLVAANATAALTPYVLGGRSLPTQADADRIIGLSGEAYISSLQPTRRPTRRQNSVQKLLPKSLKQLNPKPGHIRLRKRIGDPQATWDAVVFDGAGELANYRPR